MKRARTSSNHPRRPRRPDVANEPDLPAILERFGGEPFPHEAGHRAVVHAVPQAFEGVQHLKV